MALLRDIVDAVFFPSRAVHGIPVLDGAYSPNQRLERARVLGAPIPAPDDLAPGPDGALYVSSGTSILRCAGTDFAERSVFAELEAPVGALAWTPDGRLLAGVSGRGIGAFTAAGRPAGWLATVGGGTAGGGPIACPLSIVAAADGRIFATDGSRHNAPEQWLTDLMEHRPASGRLIVCDADLGGARVIADGLAWPYGLALTPDGHEALVTEAWTHMLAAVPAGGGRAAARRVLVHNFPAYPARIAPAAGGGYWLALFAPRAQLTEFVLRERRFRETMLAEVPPELWIGPSLAAHFNYREPTQIGRIKKLGIQKPWAPARSYGLVARLDAAGDAVESFHSRVAGTVHGITAVRAVGARVLALSKGNDTLVELPTSSAVRDQ